MPTLLRFLRKTTLWAQALDSPLWSSGDCPTGMMELALSGAGFSVWRVDSALDLHRVIVGNALSRESIGDQTYLLFKEDQIADLGLRVVNEPASSEDMFDSATRRLHGEIKGITGKKLIDLLSFLKDLPYHTMTAHQVLGHARALLIGKNFDRQQLATRHVMLGYLMKKGQLDISTQAAINVKPAGKFKPPVDTAVSSAPSA